MHKAIPTRIIDELRRDPKMLAFYSPGFYHKDREEQEALYNEMPLLRELGIPLQDLIEISWDLNQTENFSVIRMLQYNIENLLQKQGKNGSWPTLTPESNGDFVYSSEYIGNYIILLLLNKWLRYCKSRHMLDEEGINNIQSRIELCKEWTRGYLSNSNAGNNVPDEFYLEPTRISARCMFLVALNYGDIEMSSRFFGEDYVAKVADDKLMVDNGWPRNIGEPYNIEATAFASQLLMKYLKYGKNESLKNESQSCLNRGIRSLIANQSDNGGWRPIRKTENISSSAIEYTAHSLMALAKYRKRCNENYIFNDDLIAIINHRLDNGIDFLKQRMEVFHNSHPVFAWPNDYKNELHSYPNVKLSSLALSSMLKAGERPDNPTVRKGIMGVSRVINRSKSNEHLGWVEPIYFFCMLADYIEMNR